MNSHAEPMEPAAPATAAAEDRLIQGEGTPEAVWQSWLAERRPPALLVPGCLSIRSRLVVVAPHPDDEILACGGLVALHALKGGRVLVIAVTDGEASHPGSSQWSPVQLAAERRSESAAGLDILGVRGGDPVRLGLPDGGVSAHIPQLGLSIEALLHEDDLVVTTWRLDGHPDHDATGVAAARACGRVGCQLLEAPVWMWHWSRPGDPRVPWERMRAVALPVEAVDRKRRALGAHATQLAPRDGLGGGNGSEGAVLEANILERAAREVEYFFV
jgi:LmbE family N-acetylglucosaminyl deacetylase